MRVTHHGQTVEVHCEADIRALCAQTQPSIATESRRLALVYKQSEREHMEQQLARWVPPQPQTTFVGCFT